MDMDTEYAYPVYLRQELFADFRYLNIQLAN